MPSYNPVNLGSTTHAYTGVTDGVGANSIDGDFATAQQEGDDSTDQGTGGGATTKTCISQHTFASAQSVDSITYKLRSYTYQTGNNNNWDSYTHKLEYTTDGSVWTELTALTVSATYGANSGEHDVTTSNTYTSANLVDILGLRATVIATASTNDGHKWTGAYIYEIQATNIIKRSFSGVV